LLHREEIVEDIGLGERELGKEIGVVIDPIAEAAERRGIPGGAKDRRVVHMGATEAALGNRGIGRR